MNDNENRVETPETPLPNLASELAAPLNGKHEPENREELEDESGHTWHSDAGRKGAHRIHELIEAGRRYEEEHGLKSGRQRLRQLIELGKLYEQEHDPQPVGGALRSKRLSRMERDETMSTLFDCLLRMSKPSFRSELVRLAEALKSTNNGRAA